MTEPKVNPEPTAFQRSYRRTVRNMTIAKRVAEKSVVKQINPELIKKCAVMACNGGQWNHVTGTMVFNGVGNFDPIEDAYDREALMLALMKEGWRFWGYPDGHCFADNRRMLIDMIDANSAPLLLLSCVSSMTGISLGSEQ